MGNCTGETVYKPSYTELRGVARELSDSLSGRYKGDDITFVMEPNFRMRYLHKTGNFKCIFYTPEDPPPAKRAKHTKKTTHVACSHGNAISGAPLIGSRENLPETFSVPSRLVNLAMQTHTNYFGTSSTQGQVAVPSSSSSDTD